MYVLLLLLLLLALEADTRSHPTCIGPLLLCVEQLGEPS